ncbi:hypothetical protein BXT84_02565 [Sulfobacillus thermotolerans]|uniref:ABC transporter domain-containing protein n=1 Tax=Sulfobacillus thermotolerans TaxID=338644 RepID=A0ABM6RNN0_9FIRM|nr:hypothetical protein BXT84_02565 [Sulfobacillus thermotolerans]
MVTIKIEHAVVQYGRTNRPALGPLDLTIQGGECIFISGPNGGGKTTFARLLAGIVKPSSGHVSFDTLDAGNEWTPTAVGWVQQEPEHQVVAERVEDDVGITPQWYAPSYPEYVKRVEDALRFMQLERLRGRAVTTLSGGELHRTALAAIMAQQPQVWIMDEPEAMLDGFGRATLERLITHIRGEAKTVLLISHDPRWLDIADRCLWFAEGQAQWMAHETMASQIGGSWYQFAEQVRRQAPPLSPLLENALELGRVLWP